MNSHVGGTLLFAAVFLCIAIWLAFTGVRDLARGIASGGWPEAEGRVTRSRLEKSQDGTWVELEYEYEVNSQRYRSDRIAFGWSWTSSRKSDILERYSTGAAVRVRYCPGTPEIATLRTGVHFSVWMHVFCALGFAGFGVAALLSTLRKLEGPSRVKTRGAADPA